MSKKKKVSIKEQLKESKENRKTLTPEETKELHHKIMTAIVKKKNLTFKDRLLKFMFNETFGFMLITVCSGASIAMVINQSPLLNIIITIIVLGVICIVYDKLAEKYNEK